MPAVAMYRNSFAKPVVKLFLLIALLLTMAFAFAKVSAPAQAAPHAQGSHAQELACGATNAPQCG